MSDPIPDLPGWLILQTVSGESQTLDKFAARHADVSQMYVHLNYVREHWMKPGENPAIGLILCANKGVAEAGYSLARSFHKSATSPVGGGLPPSFSVQERKSQTLGGKPPPTGLGGTHEISGLEGLPNKIMAAEYQTMLPNEKLLADELEKTQRELEARRLGNMEGKACVIRHRA